VGAEARWWHPLADGRLQCDLCPRDCRLQEGQRGFCAVRQRRDGRLWLSAWGRTAGLAVDPIEKKPLAHFLPGSRVLSFGTEGCNLGCRFCQNWELSRGRQGPETARETTPEALAETAVRTGCQSVAFTYNDPVVFAEWALAVAEACRSRGLRTVAVTAGYLHAEPRRVFFGGMDAANVDLKAITEAFYTRVCLAHLQPVLETLEYLVKETAVWLELTTLLIPGLNDGEAEVARLVEWVAGRLGPEVPLHFSAFHPDFRLLEVPATPLATLRRARAQALAAGLQHVYLGNVREPGGTSTHCAGCGGLLLRREGYTLVENRLRPGGRCPDCHEPLAGRFPAGPQVEVPQ